MKTIDKISCRCIYIGLVLVLILLFPGAVKAQSGGKAAIRTCKVTKADVDAWRAKDILRGKYAKETVDAVGASTEWEGYSNDYYYNQLSSSKQKLWDGLDEICQYWMTGDGTGETMKKYNSGSLSTYMLGYVEYDGFNHNTAVKVAQMFRYANPQYYFLDTCLLSYYYTGDTSGAITLTSYSLFSGGSGRSNATAAVGKKLASWNSFISAQGSVLSKEKKAHDLIVDHTVYQSGTYDQSIYSVLCQGKSVCAGYAGTFQALCSKAGIEAISVTSGVHEWNKVKLNGSWYNVDTTFDDPISSVAVLRYTYFNRSQSKNRSVDTSQKEHTEESLWTGMLPSCTKDSGATASDPGKISGLSYSTTVSTADEKENNAGGTSIATASKITLTLNANGGYIGSSSSTTESVSVTPGKSCGSLKAAKRSGYQFLGWYTKKSGGSKVTAAAKAGTKPAALYAHWKKIKVGKGTVAGAAQAGAGKMKITAKKVSGANGYQIRYGLKSSMKGAKNTAVTGTAKVIKKLSKGKTYYIQLRAYKKDSAGKKVYGAWSKTKKLKIG